MANNVIMRDKTEKDIIFSVDLADVPYGKFISHKEADGKVVDFYEAAPGMEVLAYDEKTGRQVWARVHGWSRHIGCPLEIVTLANGEQIYTDDDPRAVYGIAKDADTLVPQRFTPSEALAGNVLVPVSDISSVISDAELYVDITDSKITKTLDPSHYGFKLDYEFGQVLGMIAGDGWWSHGKDDFVTDWKRLGDNCNGRICLADHEGFNATFLENWLRAAFINKEFFKTVHEQTKTENNGRFGDSTKYSYFIEDSDPFRHFLSDNLGGERDERTSGSANKHLPNWFASAPREFLIGLANGLVATDGTICVTHGKTKDQLAISYTSTSLRLCREFKVLLSMLGVKSSICFSKETTAGNSAWLLTISTIDSKRINLFDRLCHTRKRDIFLNTEVAINSNTVKGEYIPFPKCVSDVIFKWFSRPNIEASMRKAGGPEFEYRKYGQSLYTMAYDGSRNGFVTKSFARNFVKYIGERYSRYFSSNELVLSFYNNLDSNTELTQEMVNPVFAALIHNKVFINADAYREAMAILRRRVKIGKSCANLVAAMKAVILSDTQITGLMNEPVFMDWLRIINDDYNWSIVEKVEKTGVCIEGYDLTVPGFETFTTDTGVVLSNTMTYYVPVTEAAVKEAYEKMLPSKNLLGARDFKAHYLPQEEYILGAWLASQDGKGPVKHVFKTKEDAIKAYRLGKIDLNDNIQIIGR